MNSVEHWPCSVSKHKDQKWNDESLVWINTRIPMASCLSKSIGGRADKTVCINVTKHWTCPFNTKTNEPLLKRPCLMTLAKQNACTASLWKPVWHPHAWLSNHNYSGGTVKNTSLPTETWTSEQITQGSEDVGTHAPLDLFWQRD